MKKWRFFVPLAFALKKFVYENLNVRYRWISIPVIGQNVLLEDEKARLRDENEQVKRELEDKEFEFNEENKFLNERLEEETSKSEDSKREKENMERILTNIKELHEGIRVTFPGPKAGCRVGPKCIGDAPKRSQVYQMPGWSCYLQC